MSPAARPTITLPRRPEQVQPADQVQAEDQAAQDPRRQASEQTSASAPDDQVVQVPAATWRRAVELMEAVDRGEYLPAAEVEAAIARVERLAEMLTAIPQSPATRTVTQDVAGDARVAALRAWKPAPT
jgi:hypothetical protein